MSAVSNAAVAGTAVASGVLGGALFAFSALVLPALRRMPARESIRAMQSMNAVAPRSLLMVPLAGSAIGSAVVGIQVLAAGDVNGWGLRAAGALLGLGAFAVTAAASVPLNSSLAALDADELAASAAWAAYVRSWTRWNHVRTVAATLSAVALATSLEGVASLLP
jgi:uncharacterized membrane protein